MGGGAAGLLFYDKRALRDTVSIPVILMGRRPSWRVTGGCDGLEVCQTATNLGCGHSRQDTQLSRHHHAKMEGVWEALRGASWGGMRNKKRYMYVTAIQLWKIS